MTADIESKVSTANCVIRLGLGVRLEFTKRDSGQLLSSLSVIFIWKEKFALTAVNERS